MIFGTDVFYGHDLILAWSCGLRRPLPILAHLQHGWNPYSGFGTKHLMANRGGLTQILPKLVWNDRNARFARGMGLKRVHAIGAPFIYLMKELSEPMAPANTPERTLVFPHHHGANEGERVDTEYVDLLVRRERPEATTVCLYWREYEEDRIRHTYEDAGFNVTCHGRREHPLFLVRQVESLLQHNRVVTNRVATALFYGGWFGHRLEVYGPVSDSRSPGHADEWDAEQRRRWPELFRDGGIVGSQAHELARTELGAAAVRTPSELSQLLGWKSPRRQIGVAVDGLLAARRAARLA